MKTRQAVRGGFTLIEVLVTLLIMGMMLVSISELLTAARTTRDRIQNTQETQLAGPAILDMIERDLRGLIILDLPPTSHLRVVDRVVIGLDADSLDFITSSDNTQWTEDGDRWVRADWSEVGYRLRPNPENDDFLELFRRDAFGVDQDPFDEGSYTFLHDRVKHFDIRVFTEDGPDAEPLEEWNTNPSDPETQGLPARLEIPLIQELAPRLLREQMIIDSIEKRTIEYRRVVRLPQSLRVAAKDIPRLGIPRRGAAGGETGSGDEGKTEEEEPGGTTAGEEGKSSPGSGTQGGKR
jgi:prepilin-type N-terminal cleavage/methylation domain-containing protein